MCGIDWTAPIPKNRDQQPYALFRASFIEYLAAPNPCREAGKFRACG